MTQQTMVPLGANMHILDRTREVEIKPMHWPLASDLFVKWGYDVTGDVIEVANIDDITPELSTWGVPWKWR